MFRIFALFALLLSACAQTPATGATDVGGATEVQPPVSASRAQEPAQIGAHGLSLPATFTGTLPCADCAGIRHHLDLWPDQAYAMRREWLGREEPLVRDELGRWYVDPARSALILYGAAEAPIEWEIKAPDRLRLLDRMGEPIVSELPYELSGGPLEPTPLELLLGGMFTYLADAAIFEECLTGHRFPVAAEGERPALERAYLEARPEPGAPVLASLEGRIETRPAMEGPPRRTLIVERFSRMHPEGACPSAPGGFAPRPPELTETYWRLVRLDGMPLEGPPGGREPYLLLLEEEGQPRFTATAGCNMLSGSWSRSGDTLAFGPVRATRMACPPPIAAREQALSDALAEAASWSIAGRTLTLEDAAGSPVLEAEAAYTRF